MKGKILTFNSCLVNTFRSSTLSRKCQSSHFSSLWRHCTPSLRWSLNNMAAVGCNNMAAVVCSIQSYLWDQWVGHTTTCICLILIYKKLRHIFLSKFAFQVNCKKKLSRVTAPLVYIYTVMFYAIPVSSSMLSCILELILYSVNSRTILSL